MSTQPTRAVLFDLGGTLLDYTPAAGAAKGVALARLGVDPRDDGVVEAITTAARQVASTYGSRRSFLHRDLFRDQFVAAAALLGLEATPEDIDRFEAENLAHLFEHLTPRPDAAEVLEALRDRGMYRAVVSNADDDFLGPILERHGLAPLVDDWTSSEEADSCKPDPGIYRLALRKAGCTAADALFVGDSLQHDIAGAAAVGMRTALVSNGLPVAPLSDGLGAPARPDFELATLTELIAVIDELNGPP